MSHSKRVAAGARAMLAITMAHIQENIEAVAPTPTPNEFENEGKPAIVIRVVNHKLKAKNRAARREKNRQNKRMRHAA
jgi:hypothetical protein